MITGELKNAVRDEIGRRIENAGGRVSSSVSKKTNYLVVGEEPGSKLEKAIRLGIKIIREDELKRMFNHG